MDIGSARHRVNHHLEFSVTAIVVEGVCANNGRLRTVHLLGVGNGVGEVELGSTVAGHIDLYHHASLDVFDDIIVGSHRAFYRVGAR